MDNVMNSMPLECQATSVVVKKAHFENARHHGELDVNLFSVAVLNIRQSLQEGSKKVFIASVARVSQMHAAPMGDPAFLRPPPEPSQKSPPWIKEVNIFDMQILILPFTFMSSSSKTREYHVVYINMEEHTIHVLSPRPVPRMYNKIVEVGPLPLFSPLIVLTVLSPQRFQKMLAYEGHVRQVEASSEFTAAKSADRISVSIPFLRSVVVRALTLILHA